ncbi:MAG TPA: DUF4268 domain-containing protein [Chthonomonadaceae bacterium]|nr:DUF4268 domain-containing protein [Chthonomonadaceae bacterium]
MENDEPAIMPAHSELDVELPHNAVVVPGGKAAWNTSANIGRLRRVPLREVWQHEALGFTTWLQKNIDILNDILGLTLTDVRREQAVGSFSVDLVAETGDGGTVVIENQLEKSDHLGKLITYLAAFDAKVAVWIVAEPRQEHVRAVSWLNESRSTSFYLLKVEAAQIDDSRPAPFLTLIVGPSAESQEVGETKRELAERHHLRHRFWSELLNRARAKTTLHSTISPSYYNWIGTSSGKRGLNYNYAVRQHDAYVELYIDRGSERENLEIFHSLEARKSEIEQAFGDTLEWQELDGKRACRIGKIIRLGGYKDESKWPGLHDKMIEAMIHLEQALRTHIRQLPL